MKRQTICRWMYAAIALSIMTWTAQCAMSIAIPTAVLLYQKKKIKEEEVDA